MLDHVLSFKVEVNKFNIKIVKIKLYLFAHNGSGLGSYIVLNGPPQYRTVFSLIKNGSGTVSLKIFNGYVDKNKKYLSMFI